MFHFTGVRVLRKRDRHIVEYRRDASDRVVPVPFEVSMRISIGDGATAADILATMEEAQEQCIHQVKVILGWAEP